MGSVATILLVLGHYFLARVSSPDHVLGQTVKDAHRREGIVAARWWSLEQIEMTSEQVFPENFCELVRGLVSSAGCSSL